MGPAPARLDGGGRNVNFPARYVGSRWSRPEDYAGGLISLPILLFVCFSWLEVNECGPVFSNCYLRGSGQRRGKAWSGNQLGRL